MLTGRAPLAAVLDVVAPVGLYYGLRAAGSGIYPALLAGAVVPGISTMIRLIRVAAFDRLAVFVMTTMLIGVGVAGIAGSPRFLLAKEGWVTAIGGVWFLVALVGRSRSRSCLRARCWKADALSRASRGAVCGSAFRDFGARGACRA